MSEELKAKSLDIFQVTKILDKYDIRNINLNCQSKTIGILKDVAWKRFTQGELQHNTQGESIYEVEYLGWKWFYSGDEDDTP